MPSLAALLPSPLLPPAVAVPVSPAPEAQESADFSTILSGMVPSSTPLTPDVPTATPVPAAPSSALVKEPVLPAGGNFLPVALPVSTPAAEPGSSNTAQAKARDPVAAMSLPQAPGFVAAARPPVYKPAEETADALPTDPAASETDEPGELVTPLEAAHQPTLPHPAPSGVPAHLAMAAPAVLPPALPVVETAEARLPSRGAPALPVASPNAAVAVQPPINGTRSEVETATPITGPTAAPRAEVRSPEHSFVAIPQQTVTDQPRPIAVAMSVRIAAEPAVKEGTGLATANPAEPRTEPRAIQAPAQRLETPSAPLLEVRANTPFLRSSAEADASTAFKPVAPLAEAPVAAVPTFAAEMRASAPQISAAPQPVDVATLVDRIASARAALQPQTVAVAIPHADYGTVRIRFRHEDNALAVNLSSDDPAFRTAVAAALPPVAAPQSVSADPRTSADTSAAAPRQDAGSMAGQQGTAQQRSGQQHRTENAPARGEPRLSADRRQPGTDQAASTQGGIFA